MIPAYRSKGNAMRQERKQRDSRINYIDSLKGFTILCVVLVHIGNGFMWDAGVSPAYFAMYNSLACFVMSLFMILSGEMFRTAYTGPGPGDIKKERLLRQVINLLLLYLIWSLLLGFFKMIFGDFVNNPVTWQTLALIPVKPIQLYWYLYLLIIYYVIFGLLQKTRASVYLLLGITFCLCLVSCLIPNYLYFDLKRLLQFSFFFAAGMFLARIREGSVSPNIQKWLPAFSGILAAAAVLLGIVFWNQEIFLHDRFLVNIVIGLGISLGLYLLFRRIGWLGNNRILCRLGKNSLPIYLMHTFCLSACRAVFQKWNWRHPLPVILLSFAAGVLIPILFAWLCRKIRVYDIFFSPYQLIARKRDRKQKEF